MPVPRSGSSSVATPVPETQTLAGAEPVAPNAWTRWGGYALSVGFIAYPILVWLGLTAWRPRTVALVLFALLVPLALLRLRRARRTSSARPLAGLAVLPLVTAAALALAAWLDAAGLVLAVPVVINALLLLTFGATLRAGAQPMIERFARLIEPHLTAEKQAWCRGWTRLWCAFFVTNGAIALGLAAAAPLSWWAVYNGVIAYALIGTLLVTEWVLRRRRFGRALEPAREGGGVEEGRPT